MMVYREMLIEHLVVEWVVVRCRKIIERIKHVMITDAPSDTVNGIPKTTVH